MIFVDFTGEEYLTDLDSFANNFFLEVLDKVVAAIETFKED